MNAKRQKKAGKCVSAALVKLWTAGEAIVIIRPNNAIA